jgi:hypothetical protein
MEAASSVPSSRSKERGLIWLLCAVAAIRVFVYSAAFPFFNNVDEEAHFDLVVKYSHGGVPRGMERFSTESLQYIMAYGSPEYLKTPERFPGGKFPSPPWQQPFERVGPVLMARVAAGESNVNHESSEPPLYYAAAGLWLRLGEWCGQKEIYLLYWLRFLNMALAATLVWLGFVAARMIFPDKIFPRLAVPVLLAFIPQDAFYSIQSDALSPLFFGAAFIGVVGWLRAETPGLWLAAGTALPLAAACLVKTANLPLAAVTTGVLLFDLRRRAKAGRWRNGLPAFVLFLFLSAIPIVAWLAWNRHVAGDFMGAEAKIKLLGWTRKPFGDWWSHPIFTPGGFGTFWSELMADFWRGEFVWSGRPLALPVADVFYWSSSALLPGVGGISAIRHFKNNATPERALRFGLGCVLAAIAFLGVLSVSFDFGQCLYPSPTHPYFISGRLILGMLIPFLLLYARGLDLIFDRGKSSRPKFLALAVIVLGMTVSEIIVNAPAFASDYNWFHL